MTKFERTLQLIATWGPNTIGLANTARLYDAIAVSSVAGPLEFRQQGAAEMAVEAIDYMRGKGTKMPQWLSAIGVEIARTGT